MQVDTTKLITPKKYAKRKRKSIQWIYKLIRLGKLNAVVIDGKKFIQT